MRGNEELLDRDVFPTRVGVNRSVRLTKAVRCVFPTRVGVNRIGYLNFVANAIVFPTRVGVNRDRQSGGL